MKSSCTIGRGGDKWLLDTLKGPARWSQHLPLCSSRQQVQGAGWQVLARTSLLLSLCIKASLFVEWTATGAAIACVPCSLWGLVNR